VCKTKQQKILKLNKNNAYLQTKSQIKCARIYTHSK
jgi:hypothetical protein